MHILDKAVKIKSLHNFHSLSMKLGVVSSCSDREKHV